jgi:uncharacterized protein (DUF169 family)
MQTTREWKRMAEELKKSLGLKHAPIAITFSHDVPSGVPHFDAAMPEPKHDGRTGAVPAGCVFWIKAEDRTFTTVPEDHFNCSVGSVTHGLKTLADVMQMEDVNAILASEWVTPEEAMALPVVAMRHRFVTYGPLSETPIDPDVILLRVNAFQAMVIHDAYPDMPIAGKPQCHIIPLAKENGRVAMSTGCMLSRVRTGMSPDEMTCTIPAHRLEEALARLDARRKANAAVAGYASEDAQRFAPTD